MLLAIISLVSQSLCYSLTDYDFSSLKRSEFAFCTLHLFILSLRDNPYYTDITDKAIGLVFNVYDTFTSYNGVTFEDAVTDCIASYYVYGILVCQANNSTEKTTISSDGKNITSLCLYPHLFFLTYNSLDSINSVQRYQVNYICNTSVESSYSATQPTFIYSFLSNIHFF